MSEHPLITIAREAIEAQGARYTPPELPEPYRAPRGLFVTLHKHGKLRGCVGHLGPTKPTLAEEVADVARLAAYEDSRFPPVRPDEFPDLDIEISILTPPEPTTWEELDPRRYGVIVSSGRRRGVLLPDLEGVDTVADQVAICRRKGGIADQAPVTLERFEVVKIP